MQHNDLSRHLALWRDGVQNELTFWDNWFATKGDQWPDDFRSRLDPTREIHTDLMAGLTGTRVLDVGAGPMTKLGSCYQGRRLDLVACDPLAPFYDKIAARYGVTRPVPTQFGFAEYLSAFFPPDSFDLVHCSNALDHSFDPVRSIEEMLIVAKPGGRILLSHVRNEGESGNYEGLHQWNFDADGEDFVIWNRSIRVNASQQFASYANFSVDTSGARWMTVRIGKKRAPPMTPIVERLRELLGAMVLASASME
ncbi:class I SAM-dependent methyltransferase [Rhodoblastus acidophilus]|uniref:Class I SAM-dependent methyltransferase n=1 Tax=Candidatus Rhodoblastus alkanivorans TaxID=2954117 RepID=A0ABS9Z478_9HYPH|nr:methyltransferase domain-containing protein [Candidatus Rhodoblastus alkanivorans]MCI4679248.1 class I SAM-dependent methyltransferase [Candidatus Rhodoblastus alkanivorans]MCI4682428.1 class I SAM-dependent methyltransferase [Candidatus Rhodoblastus alkanivorans]MDI4639734.1 class I SAM-dependent methyltransferase [Rhodoblastus acidophilus]